MGKPAARITDMHTCPMVTGLVPHVGGPVVMGSFNVFTGSLPQARVGDMLVCVGPPDVIAMGSSGVFVNNRPAARMGDPTAHGGVIVAGLPTVLIGEKGGGSGGGSGSGAAGTGIGSSAEDADVKLKPVSLAYTTTPAQVQALTQAAKSGTPFCEVCYQRMMAIDAAKAALAQKPKPTPQKSPPPPIGSLAPLLVSPLPPKNPNAAIVCEITSVTLQCSHGRHPGPDNVLMVVGSAGGGSWSGGMMGISYKSTIGRSSDTISGSIAVRGGCGDHPAWAVTGAASTADVRHGSSFRFDAVDEKPPQISLWALRNTTPTLTRFDVDACQGAAIAYDIRSYPAGKLEIEIDPKELVDKITEVLKHLPVEPEKIETWKKTWFAGKVSVSAGWAEDRSWQAYYQFALSGGYDPLFSITHKGQLWGVPVPDWVAEWFKAGLFYQIGGGASFSAETTATYWPATGQTRWGDGSVTGSGKLLGGLSVEMKLANANVIDASLSCKASLDLTVAGEFADDVTVKCAFGIDPICGTARVKALWGFVEFQRTFQFTDAHKISGDWKPCQD